MTQTAIDFTSAIIVNRTVDKQDRARLSKQCRAILAWLSDGPLTNVQAAVDLSILNLTARVSELRQAGYDIRATRVRGGLWRYELAR